MSNESIKNEALIGGSELNAGLAANEQTNIDNLDKNGWSLSYISGQELDVLRSRMIVIGDLNITVSPSSQWA